MPFPEYTTLDLPALDAEMLRVWAAERTFERSVEERDSDRPWVFYEGPPSANGKPGIHHVMARTVKDLFCRFHTMLGERVERKGGWDTHGLPVELKVESELGITKDDIGRSISVADYNARCRETVMRYKAEWDALTVQMGYWVDLDNPYVTFEPAYISSVWWLLKRIYDKGLLYKGYTIQPFSPAAGTGLSSHELNMPGAYREVTDTTVAALFELSLKRTPAHWLRDEDDERVYVAAWTTTPWTLPSNTALTVGPRISYVKVRTKNPYTDEPQSIVLAADLVSAWFGGNNQPTVLSQSEPFAGEELVGLAYEPLFDFGNAIEPVGEGVDAYRIIAGDFVTTSDGTGVVHTAPSFGADDRRAAAAAGIGALTLVDEQGRFKDNVGPFSGRYIKDYREDPAYVNVDIDLAVDLKLRGQALNVAKYAHNYPHCWRTDKPVLYYPLDSWFIRASSVRERMMELNDTINWKPASTGTGRFGKWLENVQDWNLSRSRYWGIPLPIWRSECGTEEICIGGLKDLRQQIAVANEQLSLKQDVPADLHRPYIDEVILWKNGKQLIRETDLIDVWFDSGSVPYAQWGYPHAEGSEGTFRQNFPADFIAEGVDQTRGWFYTQHAIATIVSDSVAYKNVVSNGLVLDKNGQKMSKRLGNTVDPFATIATHGADATRWYLMTNAAPWDNLKFDDEGIAIVRRSFFGTLQNTYAFFALYANVDGWQAGDDSSVARTELDHWLRSRLNTLLRDVLAAYSAYEPHTAGRLIQEFVTDELSNWYIRLNRKRFWRGDLSDDKRAGYATLRQALLTVAQLMAPIAPFYADRLWRDVIVGGEDSAESVHLSLLPQVDESVIDLKIEARMRVARYIVSSGHSLRKQHQVRVRQPLQKLIIVDPEDVRGIYRKQVESKADLIKQELNVKEIEFIKSETLVKTVKPNFRVLGKKVGKLMKSTASVIGSLSQEDIRRFEEEGRLAIEVEGQPLALERDDIDIAVEEVPGRDFTSSRGLTLALDFNLTPELEREGLARELVNRIQNLRKDAGLEVTDRVKVSLSQNDSLTAALDEYGDYVRSEVLADALTFDANGEATTIDLGDGVGEVRVGLERV